MRKDAFYFYNASWSPDPVVYITNRRHAVRSEARTPLKVHSNADHVLLTLNGKELPPAAHEGVIYQRKEITLEKGANVLVATAQRDGKPITDRVTWTFDPDAAAPNHE